MAAKIPDITPDSEPHTAAAGALKRGIGLRDLILFNISAVVGLRWLAAAAHAGPGSLTLWAAAALLFFIPSAFVVSGLSRRFPTEGGLYIWVKEAFGPWHGFLCGWLYLVSNLLFFPGLLLAGVAMAAYMFGPAGAHIAESRAYTVPVALAGLWIAAITNLVGIDAGKWTSNLGGLSTYATVIILVILAILVALHSGAATRFHAVPQVRFDTINFWSQIAFAFVGLELGAILAGEIREPRRTIPRAAWISGAICAAFYIAGTAALLVLLPPGDISAVAGLAQAGLAGGLALGAAWVAPLLAGLITLGVIGQLGCYLAGNTRLPFAIGLDRYLPEAFARLHPTWRTPYLSILVQAAIATAFLFAAQFGENSRAAYQILVDMGVITALIPYVYIFAAGIHFGHRIAGASGLCVSALAVVLSTIPTGDVASVWTFEVKVIGGTLVMAAVGWLTFSRRSARA